MKIFLLLLMFSTNALAKIDVFTATTKDGYEFVISSRVCSLPDIKDEYPYYGIMYDYNKEGEPHLFCWRHSVDSSGLDLKIDNTKSTEESIGDYREFHVPYKFFKEFKL